MVVEKMANSYLASSFSSCHMTFRRSGLYFTKFRHFNNSKHDIKKNLVKKDGDFMKILNMKDVGMGWHKRERL